MKNLLREIWYEIRIQRGGWKERFHMWVVWHILPDWAVYWSSVKAAAYSTQGEYGNQHPDEVSVMDMLDRTKEWHGAR